jgi:tRNA (guanine37-N1)-methyltransferase
MRIDVITIFPEMYPAVLGASILKRAQASGLVDVAVWNLRDYTTDAHRTVDDRPFGGGPGMVMKPEPIFAAVEDVEAKHHAAAARDRHCRVVALAPTGVPLSHALARELATCTHLVLVCGHYEGIDARVHEGLIDQDISIGDYVLTGGELPSMVLIDCVVRLLPGALGHAEATVEESFSQGLLEYPQYTRPLTFRGMAVPPVLRSGDHARIARWRHQQARAQTAARRPDLLTRELADRPPRSAFRDCHDGSRYTGGKGGR